MIQFPEEACSLIISEVIENSHTDYLLIEVNDMDKLIKRIKQIIESEINEVDEDFLYEMARDRAEEEKAEKEMAVIEAKQEQEKAMQFDDDKRRAEALMPEKECGDAL